jgi:hypothetical protein
MRDKDLLQEALFTFFPDTPNWFSWAEVNSEMKPKNVIVKKELENVVTRPTNQAIESKFNELKNAEPMRLLRQERNWKLQETDWWCASDRTPTKAQLDYRTALRDLPSTASPSLDENGNLTGVTWPNKPE